MAHFSVKRELETDVAQYAIKRLISAGATVRTQAPLIRHVNDSADNWAQMWRLQQEERKVGVEPGLARA